MNTILNQENLGSCSENAFAALLNISQQEAGLPDYQISRLQSYYDTRAGMGTIPRDSGSVPEIMLKAAQTIGLAQESTWSYNIGSYAVKPTVTTYAEAATHKITSFNFVEGFGKAAVRDCLLQGKPVLLNFNLRHDFYYEDGLLSKIALKVDESALNGGHSVVIVGEDATGYIIQNSWGTGFGDEGFGKINYSQFNLHPSDFQSAFVVNGFSGHAYDNLGERNNIKTEYTALLHRTADDGGVNWWDAANLSKAQLANSLINSAEGQIIYGQESNAQFAEELYQHILHRASDAGGLTYNVTALDAGMSRGDLVGHFLESQELIAHGISLVELPHPLWA